MATRGPGLVPEPPLWLPTCEVIATLVARSTRPRRSLCERDKLIGRATASSLQQHPRRSWPWLTTLPTPCCARARAKSSDGWLTCRDAGVERLRPGAESGPLRRQIDRQVALTWAGAECS